MRLPLSICIGAFQKRKTRWTTRGASGHVWVENRKEWSMSSFSLQDNAELHSFEQNTAMIRSLTARRISSREFVKGFVEMGRLIDWDARAKSGRGNSSSTSCAPAARRAFYAATGTGFHSSV